MSHPSPALQAYSGRTDLVTEFGDDALLLFALEMRFNIDDIATEAVSCLTDGGNDRKCDAVYIDRESATAIVAQAYVSKKQASEAPAAKAADLNTAASWLFSKNYSLMVTIHLP